MKFKKRSISLAVILLISLGGILGTSATRILYNWSGQNQLANVEETTDRLISIISRIDSDLKNSNQNLSQARLDLAIMTDKYNSEVLALELKTKQYESERDALPGTEHEKTMISLANEIEAHKKTVTDMQATIDGKQLEIDGLIQVKASLEYEKGVLESELQSALNDIDTLNQEVKKANDAVATHELTTCTKLEMLPFVYQLEFRDLCTNIKAYEITEENDNTNLKEINGEIKLSDLSNSTNNSLFIGTNVDKVNSRIEKEYNNWQSVNDIIITYDGITGLLKLNINGIDELEYQAIPENISQVDTIKLIMTESNVTGFDGELLINDITLNGETDVQTYNVMDNSIILNFIGNLSGSNGDITLSFKLELLGTQDSGDNTKIDLIIGQK